VSFNPGGGGGSGSISGSADVALSNPTNEHVLAYSQSLDKWQNRAPAIVTTTTQSGTSYTLALADSGTIVETNNSSAVTITVPPNSSVAFPVGVTLAFRQYGTGQITVAAGAGVTIRSRGDAYKLAGRYAEAALTKRGTDEWILSGDLVA
jgi:hypothetical protein